MMRLLLLFLFTLSTIESSYSQPYYNQQELFLKANSIWAFGFRAGTDMNQGTAIRTAIESVESCASVADSNGNLLFYIGHETIYNRNHQPMLNGTNITPIITWQTVSGSSSQGALIVPVIDTPWKYYIFRNVPREAWDLINSSISLSYSVVDMTLDNGLGGVEAGRKNIVLDSLDKLHEAMIAIPGENCDIWVLTHAFEKFDTSITDTPGFKAWHITAGGIQKTPIYSINNFLPPSSSPFTFGAGHMAVSPNRRNIAMASYESPLLSGALLAKFDPATGSVSDLKPIYGNDLYGSGYGVCFSPDNTKLYLQSTETLKQFNVTSNNENIINNSMKVISVRRSKILYYAVSLKLYDNKVYLPNLNDMYIGNGLTTSLFGVFHVKSINRINNPNLEGQACGYEENVISLLDSTEGICTLPNEVVFPIVKESISTLYDSICASGNNNYEPKALYVKDGYRFIEWDNGQTGNSREINQPGTYWVKYRTASCDRYIDTFHITAVDLNFTLGEDKSVLFCGQQGSLLTLSVNIPNSMMKWQDGTEAGRYRVTEPGIYWVEVSKGGCTASDTITINDLQQNFELGPDRTFCKGDPISISLPFPDTLPGSAIFNWSTPSLAESKYITDTGIYWVEIIQPPCVFADTLRVSTEICTCHADIPNAFTPNGDGINDYFLPIIEPLCPISTYTMNIFNRFGERVFSSTQLDQGWDGYYKGVPVEINTYFYEIRFTAGTRLQEHYYKGDLVLIR